MRRLYIIGAVFLLAAGGAWWYVADIGAGLEAQETKWYFTPVGEQSGVPMTDVAVKIGIDIHQVGVYTGTCFDMNGSAWKMDANEIAGAICWWAGGGNEIGVFHENGIIKVKKGVVDEGSAETPGFRGNFVTILEIK